MMRALSASELLEIWEHSLTLMPLWRAVVLLAQLSIGERDARLLMLREWTFGPHLTGLVMCPNCDGWLEFSFSAADLRLASTTQNDEDVAEGLQGLSVRVDDYEVHFRLPNSLDLIALAEDEADEVSAQQRLLQRCVLVAYHHQEEEVTSQLPPEVVTAIVEQMGLADPQGDLQLALSCPSCDFHWQAAFDIESFFWTEINAWAHRMLREVHSLASAYGWSQADILAMSSRRRRIYLEMITA
jgi:hypothetical protein